MTNVVQMKDYIPQEVVIDGITIKQDAEGRYCLNDVHRASGGAAKDQVNHWLQLGKVKSMVKLIPGKPGVKNLEAKVGRYGGTYAVKELVYAYAMWTDPLQHLPATLVWVDSGSFVYGPCRWLPDRMGIKVMLD